MSRPPRIQFQGAYYHIYNRGVDKQNIFRCDEDRRLFLSLLSETVPRFNVHLYAYCLMDNHYHLFLQTSLPNLSKVLWNLSHQYVQFFNRRHDRVGPLFQSRFKSNIVDVDAYAVTLLRYIHLNPLDAGLAEKPEDFLWSSYCSYTGKLPAWSWLNCQWGLQLFDNDTQRARALFIRAHEQWGQPPVPAPVGSAGAWPQLKVKISSGGKRRTR